MPRLTPAEPKPLVKVLDAEWRQIEPFLLEGPNRRGRPPTDLRRTFEAMRWVAQTGKPWRALPPEHGEAGSVRRFYARLSQSGRLDRLLANFADPRAGNDAETRAYLTARLAVREIAKLQDRQARGVTGRPKDS